MQIWLCVSREAIWQWHHQRSPKCLLPIASHRKERQHREWSHCVQLIKTHWIIYILTLNSRKGHVNWGQLMTLIFWGYDIHIPMHINDRISMVLLVFPLAWLAQKLLVKNSLVLKCHHFDFFTPVTSFLPDLKMTSVKIVKLVRPYPMPFTASL